MASRDTIVIGASAGGFEAIQQLVAQFPGNIPAAVFVILHIHGKGAGILPDILNRVGTLPAAEAVDGELILPGRIYVAPPDYHLMIESERVHLSHGPKENLQRPCINVMFRSAAASRGDRVIGVLLSGLLDDGAAGLWEIQQQLGVTVVQDPAEATFRSMPENAIRGLNVQYIVRLAEMTPLLVKLAMADNQSAHSSRSASRSATEQSNQACPECGGAMTATRLGNIVEFRCHTGHRFGLETLISDKASTIERSLNMALSQSEELTDLLELSLRETRGERAHKIMEEIAERKVEQQSLRTMTDRSKLSEKE